MKEGADGEKRADRQQPRPDDIPHGYELPQIQPGEVPGKDRKKDESVIVDGILKRIEDGEWEDGPREDPDKRSDKPPTLH